MTTKDIIHSKRHLFYETSHSPSLVDIVGEDMIDKIIDFCFIANPYYPGKNLIKKLQNRLPILIKSYPSSNSNLSLQHLSSVLHIQPEQLIIGNGASELITVIQKEFINDIAIPVPTFSEYTEKLKKQENANLYQLPAHNNYQLHLNDYADWINTKGITSALIINPGNPTGQLIPLQEMIDFLNNMKHLQIIIVDESFIDFAGNTIPSLMPHITNFPNVIIVRSMSKHCGVPGLRLGYCCSSNKEIIQRIQNSLPVWNINTIAEYFLTQLSATDTEYHIARKQVIQDVAFLYSELIKIKGFYIYPTGTNFILIKSLCKLTAGQLQQILLEEFHLYVRDCSNKTGLDNFHIRVASQGKKKDKKLITALKKISKQYS